jgi:hypothetical protein
MSTRPVSASLRLGKRRVSGRAGKYVPARAQITVEFGLDRIQKLGYVLILIDQDQVVAGDETAGVVADGRSGSRVVAVDDRKSHGFGEVRKQCAFADSAWPIENHDSFLGDTGLEHLDQAALDDTDQYAFYAGIMA